MGTARAVEGVLKLLRNAQGATLENALGEIAHRGRGLSQEGGDPKGKEREEARLTNKRAAP